MNGRPQSDELEALRQQNLLLVEENARLKEMLGLEAQESPTPGPIAIVPNPGQVG